MSVIHSVMGNLLASGFFFQLDSWVILVSSILFIRQFRVVLAAEQGRKQDLARKLYKANPGFSISVLIPCLEVRQVDSCMQLLQSLYGQEYPLAKVSIHLVVNQEVADHLRSRSLHSVVKLWVFPSPTRHVGNALRWLIERCLALPGTGLFIFLKPETVVKPDFLQHVSSRGSDYQAMQGYIALKRQPANLIGQVAALSKRLINRIWNAGAYHLGHSARLLDTGWVVQREVLEMVPFYQGEDFETLEYTLRLNASGIRVSWAPQVVVYSAEEERLFATVNQRLASGFNRLRLFFQYSPLLLSRVVMKGQLAALEQIFGLLKPSHFLLGAFFVVGWLLAAYLPASPVSTASAVPVKQFLGLYSSTWLYLAALVSAIQIFTVFVARCRQQDIVTFVFFTPIAYLTGIVLLPLALLKQLFESVSGGLASREQSARRFAQVRNRFIDPDDEGEPGSVPVPRHVRLRQMEMKHHEAVFSPEELSYSDAAGHEQNKASSQNTAQNIARTGRTSLPSGAQKALERLSQNLIPTKNFASTKKESLYSNESDRVKTEKATPNHLQSGYPEMSQTAAAQEKGPFRSQFKLDANPPVEQMMTLPLMKDGRQLHCILRVLTHATTEGDAVYQFKLQYKSVAFSTEIYRSWDHAFYELHAKLTEKGLTILSCGSCGNFFSPRIDDPDLKNAGVCLYNKTGKNITLPEDKVTVISQACLYYCPSSERESILRSWKESLQQTLPSA